MLARFKIPFLPPARLAELSRDSQCLERDGNGPKVLRLRDGRILKIFYPRSGLSLSRLRPAALRFVTNAVGLRQRSIQTVEVEKVWRLGREGFAVLYVPVPGHSLRGLLDSSPELETQLRPTLAAFIDQLHHQGIYFRSLHLGNIIHLPSGDFGLIDIADLSLHRGALPPRLIRRNRAHFEHYVAKEGVSFDCAALWRESRNA